MATKPDKPRSQRVSKAKSKSGTEYTIHEVCTMLDFPDEESEWHQLFSYLTTHGVKWRHIDTPHGPQYLFNKEVMNELRAVKQVNEERRRVAAANREVQGYIDAAIEKMKRDKHLSPGHGE